jgi:phosphoribosylanthranilate isomerase
VTPFKICGLSTPETVDASVAVGAAHLGFNFFAPSPRFVEPGAAASLIARVPSGVGRVAVLVAPDDARGTTAGGASHRRREGQEGLSRHHPHRKEKIEA